MSDRQLVATRSLRAVVPVPGIALAAVMLALTASAGFLAGWMPIAFSIVTVFLFAGPHNWFEARYFLTRLPGRWGKLQPYFLVGFGGMFALSAAAWSLPWLGRVFQFSNADWSLAVGTWNTLLIGWVLVLIQMRMRQPPRRDWNWTLPAGLGLVAVNWLAPHSFGLSLVYFHPLMALWLFDRELARTRPQWRPIYHKALLAVPAVLIALWWKLHDAPSLAATEAVDEAIAQHAGAGLVVGVSSHFLVAAHTFLEMVHYGIWIVAMPIVGLRAWPWRMDNVPMARRGNAWRWGIVGLLLVGLGVSIALWLGFRADYAVTRYIYFQVALLHVLAEAPFLLRAL